MSRSAYEHTEEHVANEEVMCGAEVRQCVQGKLIPFVRYVVFVVM